MRRAIDFRKVAPYALLAPGLLFLAVFYIYPAIQMFLVSLWTGNINDGFQQSWNWAIYPEALTEYWPWIARSIVYGGLATILAFALGFPLAYAIAFRGGAYKNLLLFMVIAPFFTSFLLRTISWKIILSDNGIVLGPLKDIGIIPADFQLLATPAAVIAGITYNFLPFMTLPCTWPSRRSTGASSRPPRTCTPGRGDRRAPSSAGSSAASSGAIVGGVMELRRDHAGHPGRIAGMIIGTFLISEAFIRIVLPLSLPGIFAGSLLVFIPAMGDYVNAELLGQPAVADDRQRHPGPLPEGDRLSDRLGPVVHPHGRDPRRRVPVRPGHRDRGADLMAVAGAEATANPPSSRTKPTFGMRLGKTVDRWLLPLYVLFVVLYLILPVVVMIVFSFNDPTGRSNLTWKSFSIDAWLQSARAAGPARGRVQQHPHRLRRDDRRRRSSGR